MGRNKYSDPRYFVQAGDKGHNPLHINLIRANKPKKTSEDEVKVVADLIYSLTHTDHAFAVAANQRGWEAPIFVTRWALDTINLLPMSDALDEGHHILLRSNISPTLYRNPSYKPVSNDMTYVEESCLSFEGDSGLMKRYNKIEVTAEVLDMVARRGNRKRNQWHKVTLVLEGLASQIFQHEYDHLLGVGVWNMREI